MAKRQLCDRCERPALGPLSCSAASSALRRCTSRGWWLARGGWLGLGLVLLGAVAGPAQDVAAQADNRQIEVQVNLPYALQFGFGSYDVGGLSVHVFRVPVPHTLRLGPEAAANTDPTSSRSIRLISGGGSGGTGSAALARMNSGTGERTSARPQPDSASAPPTSNVI